jgi:hypothetical protein
MQAGMLLVWYLGCERYDIECILHEDIYIYSIKVSLDGNTESILSM